MTKCAELANLIGNINSGGGGNNRNILINGGMNVAQRGTSSADTSATGYYTVDRWQLVNVNTSATITITQDNDTPTGFGKSTKLACTGADTSVASNEIIKFRQKIEGRRLFSFAKGTSSAKPFAVSFYVKGNDTATYACELLDQENTRQMTQLFNVTTNWTRIELTFPADTTGTITFDNTSRFQIQFVFHAGSQYTDGTLNSSAFASTTDGNRYGGITSFVDSTSRTFFITGVQLEVGQNPTAFEHRAFGDEVRLCQRYYAKSYGYGTAPGSNTPGGAVYMRFPNNISNRTDLGTRFPVTMRGTPSLTPYSLNGTVDNVSDCSTGSTHLANRGVSSVLNIGQTGFGGFTMSTSFDETGGYHYEAEAEL